MQDKIVETRFAAFEQTMIAEGLPQIAIETFKYYYQQLIDGKSGYIPEKDINPVASLPDAELFDQKLSDSGRREMPKTVVIKLNGGLGTSMGLDKVKSLIEVRDGLSFLDIIARQALSNQVPLILMNSFATREDSLEVLKKYPELKKYGIALDFVQHKVPKINQADLQPIRHPKAPYLEWCPPGHGDIYTALVTSGTLNRLLDAGYEYAFISNADNLGANLDETILGYFVQHKYPFMMEVADRTMADKKGGHLARLADGRLILRESAQCKEEDIASFQDINRHKYFNTNNLWLNLKALDLILTERDQILGLPLICNNKNVDPRDKNSTPVYQLETAMGSAISVFSRAQAIRVSRTRFAPVKTTNDLFIIRSDAYSLTENFELLPAQSLQGQLPSVELDGRYFKSIDDFEERLPHGIPSLLSCQELSVHGDVKFGGDITIKGKVMINNQSEKQIFIEHNSVIHSESSIN